MLPALGEHGRSGASSPRASRLSRLAAPTPNFRRPAETPFGKIRPDFDGFSLAEMSDWLDPQTPAATAGPSTSRKAPLHNYEGTPMNSAVLPSRTPAPSHITPEGKRRRRSLVDPPHHADDLFSRRLADSTRRTPLVPLPTQLNELAVPHESASAQSRRTSSSASSTGTTMVAPTPVPPTYPSSRRAPVGAVVGGKMPSRADRARAAGIPLLSSRAAQRSASALQYGRAGPVVPERQAAASAVQYEKEPPRGPSTATESIAQSATVVETSSPAAPGNVRSEIEGPEPTPAAHPTRKSLDTQRPLYASYRRSLDHGPSLHQVTPRSGSTSISTPLSAVSLAPSASTLDGRPEHWNLSMDAAVASPTPAFPTASVSGDDDERQLPNANDGNESSRILERSYSTSTPAPHPAVDNLPSQGMERTRSVRETIPRSAASSSAHMTQPPNGRRWPEEDDRRESGSILGFLTGLFLSTPAPPPAPAPSPSKSSQRGSGATAKPSKDTRRPARPVSATDSRSGATTRRAPKDTQASTTRRQPLGESRMANMANAPVSRQKRKEPPSPIKPAQRRVAAAGAAPSTSRSRQVLSQPVTQSKQASSSRPLRAQVALPSASTASIPSHLHQSNAAPRPRPQRIMPFVAQHLARLPKPGEGSTAAGKPVSIADHERARELAIRKAMFERAPPPAEATLEASTAQPARKATPTNESARSQSVRVPGEATRRRAEIQAENRRRREEKEAEQARIAAEQARIRAEIEAELDRQARQATVFRPNPLPAMYNHHKSR